MQHKRDDHPAVKKDKDEKMEEKAKPDYIDLDKDGNKKESMKKAAADAKASKKPKKKEKEEKEEKLEEGGNKRVMELADQHDVSNEVAQSAMTMMNKGKSEKEAIKMAKRKHAGGDKKKKDMKESLKRKIRVRIKK